MRLSVLQLEAGIVATDNFVFSDTSNGSAIRRVTWGGAVARMADQATLVTANAQMRIATGGVDTNELQDSGVTEPKLGISNAPVDDYVLAYDGPNSVMVWRAEGSGPPPLTHTRYFASGTDRIFGEADYTGGLAFTSNTFTIPTFTVNSYWAIAVPASQPITSIVLLDVTGTGLYYPLYARVGPDSIAGENHNIWISNIVFFPVNSGQMLRIS